MVKLTDNIKYLKTVGPRREHFLNQLGIYTVKDLIYYFPKTIQDRREISSLTTKIFPSQKITILGKILNYQIIHTKGNYGIFKMGIKTGILHQPLVYLLWFKKLNKKYDVFSTLKKHFDTNSNKYILAYGTVSDKTKRIPEIYVEDYEIINDINEKTIHTNRLVPVYVLNENLSQQWFRELIFNTLENIIVDEYLPEKILTSENFLPLNTAIKNVHFPDTLQLCQQARRRLVFDKFLSLQIEIQKIKKQIKQKQKIGKYQIKRTLLTPFKNRLSELIPNFDFTTAQKKVINELFKDMLSSSAMNRILVGDVGSGKTLVAISCILLAVENGYQTAFMAPTEILAQQHYFNLKSYLS